LGVILKKQLDLDYLPKSGNFE